MHTQSFKERKHLLFRPDLKYDILKYLEFVFSNKVWNTFRLFFDCALHSLEVEKYILFKENTRHCHLSTCIDVCYSRMSTEQHPWANIIVDVLELKKWRLSGMASWLDVIQLLSVHIQVF